MPKRSLIAVAFVVGLETSAYSWNNFGHETVAYLAYQQLTPKTRGRVKALLKLNPYYKRIWPSMVPPAVSGPDRDMMIFMIAATWPDQIKSDGSYHSDGPANGDRPPADPSAKQNIGYSDHARHKYWHFVDTPFTQDGTSPLPAIPDPNAQTQIAVFRGVLASNSSDRLKSYDLVWLLHLVGDVHQPLHCSTRVSAASLDGDAGGNGVHLSCTGCGTNFHSYWDGAGGKSTSLKTVVSSARKLPAPDPTLAAKSDEKDWIAESFQAAERQVYVTPIVAGAGPFSLTTKYRTDAKTLAQERLALGGARLANLLNNELK